MKGKPKTAGMALLAAALLAPCAMAQPAGEQCGACHDVRAKLAQSTHGKLGCQDCHSGHDEYPHPKDSPKPACATCHPSQAEGHAKSVHGQALQKGNAAAPDCATCHNSAHETAKATSQAFRKAAPDTCGMCHGEVLEQYKASVHGNAVSRDVPDAPVCTDCHGEHSILSPKDAASSVNARRVKDTCARCHGDVRLSGKFGLPPDRITSFEGSFHGLAAKAGNQTVANCASCHGFHNILPSSDPKSTVNARNLPATCGKCHPGAGTRFALGAVHIAEGGAKEPVAARWVRAAYLFLIPFTIGFMILHHGGDWIRKTIRLRFAAAGPARPPARTFRMYPMERVQHAGLAISFLALAWTGFALKYPDAWWVRPVLAWEASWPVRGTLHRIAAIVFTITAALHALTLIFSAKLRHHWLELRPNRQDVTEGLGRLAYNAGLQSKSPAASAHSYIEKIEYWAVVWGAAVMGLTGYMLWANNLSLRFIPKAWLDVATSIHFYEAVLATLAILVWHFYSVIFDPDVYPMDTAWLTGYSVRPTSYPDAQQRIAHATEPATEADVSAPSALSAPSTPENKHSDTALEPPA